MSDKPNQRRCLAGRVVGWVCALGLAWTAWGAEPATQKVKGFRYPDYDERGQLRFEMLGDEALFPGNGPIQIVNLRLTFFEEGKAMLLMTTPQCEFDRTQRTAASTAAVRVARADMLLTGTGFAWQSRDSTIAIHRDTKVVLRNMREPAKNLSAPEPPAAPEARAGTTNAAGHAATP